MDQKNSAIILSKNKYLNDLSINLLSIEDFQELLAKRHVVENLYTHPVVVSLLGKILSNFTNHSISSLDKLLDDILSVSTYNNSFSLVFRHPHNEKLFTYTLKDDTLIYTKQSFIKNSCIEKTNYFDKFGKKIHEPDKFFYKLSKTSYNHEDYNEEGYSL